MRVNIVSYDKGKWVLYDYACRLGEALRPLVDLVSLSDRQQPGYDVTLHINYSGLLQIQVPGLHCTLVTHIDKPEKFALVNAHAQSGVIGYCMSEETARRMNALTGTRSFFGFPPPSMLQPPSARRLNFMISSRVYEDGRKNEDWVPNFFSVFNKNDVTIRIMGAGWEPWVSLLTEKGYEIDFVSNFNIDVYLEWLKISDYLLYTGHDEGALGTLDALLYQVVPICTAQGYHLEQKGKMLLFQTRQELNEIAIKIKLILEEQRCNSLRLTDWEGFAKRHLFIWQRMLDLSKQSGVAVGVQQHAPPPQPYKNQRDSSALGLELEPPYFFGVYEKFQLVGDDPFSTEGWIHHCRAIINQWNSGQLLGAPINYRVVVEKISDLLVSKRTISILDVGGGFGDNFFYIEKLLGPLSERVSYLVVDNQRQCDLGKEVFGRRNKNISFATEIPKNSFDLIVVIGTLQYIEDWRAFVRDITQKSTNAVFISRTPLNKASPTFITVQSICPALGSSALRKIGESNVNVINEDELNLVFEENGFLVEKSLFVQDYSENFKRLPIGYTDIQYVDKVFCKT